MKAITVIIGDEILLGQVTDTNSGAISRAIAPLGWELMRTVTVGDDASAIEKAVKESLADADLVITTGGLGPTKDDITKLTLASVTGGKLIEHQPSLLNLKRIMESRNLILNELTRSQALVPDTCTPIVNTCGTAPIMWFDIDTKILISMPGVPFETETALKHDIVPRLAALRGDKSYVTHRVILLTGRSESSVAEQIDSWEDALPEGFHLAYLPNSGYLRLRLDGHGTNKNHLDREADRLAEELTGFLGDDVWLTRDLTPAQALLEELIAAGLTVSTAESCTGGNIAATLTAIPGSSAAVAGGAVTYSNKAKQDLLGVNSETLSRYGAVSEPTVTEMAAGSRKAFHTDLAIATSGIAGPGGGSEEKPVGTVCIGISCGDMSEQMTVHLPGDRKRVIERTVNTALIAALRMLRKYLAKVHNNS